MHHATTRELQYRDYILPKGTILIPNIPALGRSGELFADPHTFDPPSFLHSNPKHGSLAQTTDIPSRDHFQFGFGRRSCPGSHVAEASLYIAFARILWGLDITQVPGESLDMGYQRGTVSTQVRLSMITDGYSESDRRLGEKPKAFEVNIAYRTSKHRRVIEDLFELH